MSPIPHPDDRVATYLLVLGDHLPDPNTGHQVPEADRITAVVEAAVVAEAAGFTGIAVGEHHFERYVVSAPQLVLASIAARTDTLRLATAVTLLAHGDPVRFAEELATLDVLSGGRAELAVARGVAPRADAAFGIEPDDLRPRFEEGLRLLLRLLTETDVTWRGRYRAPLNRVTVTPRPVRRPDLWVGSGSAVSADLAAELGLPLMLPSTLVDPDKYLPIVQRYRERIAAAGHGLGRVSLPSHLYVGPTTDSARERWAPHLMSYAAFAHPWRGTGQPSDLIVNELLTGAAVVGDPTAVADQLNDLTARLGLDAHLVLMDAGGLPAADVHDAIRLFGAEVIPRLK